MAQEKSDFFVILTRDELKRLILAMGCLISESPRAERSEEDEKLYSKLSILEKEEAN